MSADGKTKGNVNTDSYGNTDVTIGGIAGSVLSSGGGANTVVTKTAAAAPSSTVVVFEQTTNAVPGTATATILPSANIDSLTIIADNQVGTIGGTVVNNVTASPYNNLNTLNRTTVTQDAGGNNIAVLSEFSSAPAMGSSTLTINSTGAVGGNVSASGSGGATVSNAGKVSKNVTAASINTATTSSSLSNFDAKGNFLGSVGSTANTSTTGKAAVTNATGASIGGSVTVNGTGSASLTNAGTITGTATINSTGIAATTASKSVFTDKGVNTFNSFASTSTPNGGAATLTMTGGSIGGAVSASADGGVVASVTGGTLKSDLNGTSVATATTGSSENVNDSTGAFVSSKSANTAVAVGKAVTLDVAKGGTISGNTTLNGDGGVTITNAGTLGGSVSATSARSLNTANSTVNTAVKGGTNTVSSSATQTVGGSVSVTNSGTGLVGTGVASINATAVGDVTLVNNGTVRGQTFGTSQGTLVTSTSDVTFTTALTKGIAPAFDVNTNVSKQNFTNATTAIGGSVNGTYTGANGTLNFFPAADGSIFQVADKSSTVAISGTVFGNVNSTAGSNNTASTQAFNSTSVLDTDPAGANGTVNSSNVFHFVSTPTAGGASTVTVTGTVGQSNVPSGGSIFSAGTTASNVTLTNATVSGSVSSNASPGLYGEVFDFSQSNDQTVTKGVFVTNNISETSTGKITRTGGAASVNVVGTTTVGGSVTVNGISSASSSIDAAAKVGGNLAVATGGQDTTSSTVSTYARDSKGAYTATNLVTNTTAPAAASGNAVVSVAGTVGGTTSASATRGDATVTVTGVSVGNISANAIGVGNATSTLNTYAGKSNSGATSFGGLALTMTSTTSTSAQTVTGGKASVVIDTAQALKNTLTPATNGNVSASGLGGASIAVTSGSIVGGSLFSGSAFGQTNSSSTTTFGASQNLTSSSTTVLVGGIAAIDNAGQVNGSVTARGVNATVNNTGKIAGSVDVASLFNLPSQTVTDINQLVPSLRSQTTVNTTTAIGGDSKFTNAASATVSGSVNISGKTGSVTNNGFVLGTTTLGAGVGDYAQTTTLTGSTTANTLAQPAALFTQTYTANQNNISGGFNVTGATVASPITGLPIKTSNVVATINLNSGSATLGNITAQRDAAGARLTNTTVNLNGSGFLGADTIGALATPNLVLSKEATAAGFGVPVAVRVTGVQSLNKTGAGTFVIYGQAFVPAAAPGLLPTYTLDVGSFNINGGEVQLNVAPIGTNTEFGINGDINNAATLVIGRRVNTPVAAIGNALVGIGPERIAGITVRENGNFTQAATGTLVVGITPSLVRFSPVGVSTGGSASEPLGPVTSGVNIPYFTTPVNAGVAAANSRVNITGNLNLAGSVMVDVSRDALFSNGDGYVLFTYTGTGAVTATAASSIASPFVKFGLTNDTTAKTVTIAASRISYATGATNPNAVSAAVGLDSAIPVIVSRIKTDAAGGAGFTTVSQIGYSQDLANIVSALDWRLSSTQAAQVFDELSSAEIYGSLSSVNQNVVFGDTVNQLTARRAYGEKLGTSLWFNPVASFARYGGTASGASQIKVDSYGGSMGLSVAYAANGAAGFGGSYGEHSIHAVGSDETGRVRTWTIGAYVTQGFGNFYANASVAYGISRFNVDRTLTLLARTIQGNFRGNQFDGAVEIGYDYKAGGSLVVTPFAKAAVRSFSMNAFTETGGGGAGLMVDKKTKSIFTPVLGVKLGALLGDPDGAAARPYAKAYYTFMGDIGNDRSVSYLGGGNAFTLVGVKPKGYGTIEAGVDGSITNRLSIYLSGAYSTGGNNEVGTVRGGLRLGF